MASSAKQSPQNTRTPNRTFDGSFADASSLPKADIAASEEPNVAALQEALASTRDLHERLRAKTSSLAADLATSRKELKDATNRWEGLVNLNEAVDGDKKKLSIENTAPAEQKAALRAAPKDVERRIRLLRDVLENKKSKMTLPKYKERVEKGRSEKIRIHPRRPNLDSKESNPGTQRVSYGNHGPRASNFYHNSRRKDTLDRSIHNHPSPKPTGLTDEIPESNYNPGLPNRPSLIESRKAQRENEISRNFDSRDEDADMKETFPEATCSNESFPQEILFRDIGNRDDPENESKNDGIAVVDNVEIRASTRPRSTRSCSIVSDSVCSDSDSMWTSDHSENSPVLEDGHPFLLIKPEILRLSLLAYQVWRQHPQDTRGSSSSRSGKPTERTDNDSFVTPNKRSFASFAKNRRADDDEEDRDGDREGKRRKRATKQSLGGQLSLACPFVKKNPLKYRGCYAYVIRRIQDVKNHLSRYHQPPIYCPRCKLIFDTEDDRDDHSETVVCEANNIITHEGLTRAQKTLLAKRVSGKMNPQDQWFTIFDILFPNHQPRPQSAYINAELSVDLVGFQDMMLADGPNIIITILTSRGVELSSIANEERDLDALLRSTIAEGLQILVERWSDSLLSGSANDYDSGSGLAGSVESPANSNARVPQASSSMTQECLSVCDHADITRQPPDTALAGSDHDGEDLIDPEFLQGLDSAAQQASARPVWEDLDTEAEQRRVSHTAGPEHTILPFRDGMVGRSSADLTIGGGYNEDEFSENTIQLSDWTNFDSWMRDQDKAT